MSVNIKRYFTVEFHFDDILMMNIEIKSRSIKLQMNGFIKTDHLYNTILQFLHEPVDEHEHDKSKIVHCL